MSGPEWLWLYLSVLFGWWLIMGCVLFGVWSLTDGEADLKGEARLFLLGPLWPLALPLALARGAAWLWRQAFPKEKL